MNAARRCRGVLLLGLGALSSCAWSNPDNRPVWNAFEQHLVPDQQGLFVATLPLTVPGGLLALLTDAIVVHPVQIVDDAVDDAGELWVENDPDWNDAYYTEMAFLPLRVTFTPVVFVGSFIGRSLFDIPNEARRASVDPSPEAPSEAERAAWEAERRRRFVDWLADLPVAPEAPCPGVPEWHEDLAGPLANALAQGATVRTQVYVALLGAAVVRFGDCDVLSALRDPDAVVRYATLRRWPASVAIPEAVVEVLRRDPCESVREQLERRGGR